MTQIGDLICTQNDQCGTVTDIYDESRSGVMELGGGKRVGFLEEDIALRHEAAQSVPEDPVDEICDGTSVCFVIKCKDPKLHEENSFYYETKLTGISKLLQETLSTVWRHINPYHITHHIQDIELHPPSLPVVEYSPPRGFGHRINDYSKLYSQLDWPKPPPVGIYEKIERMPKLSDAFSRGLAECFKSKDSDAFSTCLNNLKHGAENLHSQRGQEGKNDDTGIRSYECFGAKNFQDCMGGKNVPGHTNGDL